MPETRSTVFTRPGDTFHTHGLEPGAEIQAVTLCADPDRWYMGPLTIHGDLPTLLALADSLVAACWTLKTAADNAAAPYVPAGPPKTLRMPPHDPTGVRVKNDSAVVAAESAVEG